MCGICGSLRLDGGRVPQETVRRMCAAVRHRGPDDQGVFVAPEVTMGAARLAIIDVLGGHQPVSNETGTVWVAQNGEIYNFRQLRSELQAEGHRFATHSDTEVIVHLYESRGSGFVESLRGMFALAVWDAQAGRLLLARDRLGIKPLFHGEHAGVLYFGSEIKALLAAGFPRELDPVALHDYLSFDYVPGPRTMFAGIRKLPAGCVLEAQAGGGAPGVRRYWDFPQAVGQGVEATSDQDRLKGMLLDRLTDAVQSHLESDVPVGAFLSGGVDSGVVVALMSRVSDRPVRTFSVGFREKSYDELPQARRIASAFGTEHTEIVVEPRVEEVVDSLVGAFDEPFADSSAVAQWYVARAAAQHVKVVLSGDGGDEVFGGYVTYQADQLRSAYARLPGWVAHRALPWLADRLPASDRKMSLDLKARRFVHNAAADPLAAHVGWRAIAGDDMKRRLYAAGFPAAAHDSFGAFRQAYCGRSDHDLLNRLMVVDAKISLVDDMLTKVDRTSMAHGLEVRVPLLDHHLVEWMTLLPSRWKVRRLQLKVLFRAVARELLPAGAADRPKAGFHVPMPSWLRGELRPFLEDRLSPGRLRRQGVLDAAYVGELVEAHMSGKQDLSRNLWGLLLFSSWFDRYMGGA